MWTDFFDMILLITLAKRPDRLRAATQELSRYNIPFQVFWAPEMDDKHFGHWTTMVSLTQYYANYKNVLVFEDDVLFLQDPGPTMEACVKDLASLPWDLFYLGPNTHHPFTRFETPHLLPLREAYSTHAIAFSQKAMIQTIDFEWTGRMFDVMLADHIQPKGQSYCSYPMLATQRDGFSDIDGKQVWNGYIQERFNKHVAPLL